MKCSACGEKPKGKDNSFPKAVIEINNPENIVLMRKVVIPASLGDDEAIPAAVGKYHNVLLNYEANNHSYLYSSDGIPTLLTSDVAAELEARVRNLEVSLIDETNARQNADHDLQEDLNTKANTSDLSSVAFSGAYADLYGKPTIGNGTLTIQRNSTTIGTFKANTTSSPTIDISVPTTPSDIGAQPLIDSNDKLDADLVDDTNSTHKFATAAQLSAIDTALQPADIDKTVVSDVALNDLISTSTVNLDVTTENLLSGVSSTNTIALPVASTTEAGVMNSSTYDAVTSNTSNINALLNGAVAVTGLSASPSQSDITTAWQTETGLATLINRASVYDVSNDKVWTYYTNDTTWHAASNTTQVTVNQATNSSLGTVKGSTNTGQAYVENDGTLSVNGWDAMSAQVGDNTADIGDLQTAVAGKQDKLTAGTNITISSNTISATDTTYTAGTGLDLNGTEFSVDTTTIQEKLTAGDAIDITGNVISADINPADFFTANDVVTGTGSSFVLNKTISTRIKNIDLLGNAEQQAGADPANPQTVNVVTGVQTIKVAGKNLFDYNTISGTNITIADGVVSSTAGSLTTATQNGLIYVKMQGQLALSATAYTDGNISTTGNGLRFRAYYTDGTSENILGWSNSDTTATTVTGVTDDTKEVDYIIITYGTSSNNIWHISDIQIEAGSTATNYEPYQGSQSYTVNLGTIELAKLDDYQDYIYKSGDDWYLHKETGKVTLTGGSDEAWSAGNDDIYFFHTVTGAYTPESRSTRAEILSNNFTAATYLQVASTTIDYGIALDANNAGRLAIRNKDYTSVVTFKTWLASNNVTVYYPLETTTNTKITDNSLISQLDLLRNARSYEGQTDFVAIATDNNLPVILGIAAYRNSSAAVLDIIGSIQEYQVQANWAQADSTAADYIKNKPTLATVATTGDYDDLIDKPSLATVATSGAYADLTGKPSLATVATSGAYADLSGKPNLAAVATSGNYNDLSNKPTIPTVNNATLTIQQNGATVKTFTANASSNVTANITSPVITMTDTDPGEGAPLAANNFIAVYNASPEIN